MEYAIKLFEALCKFATVVIILGGIYLLWKEGRTK